MEYTFEEKFSEKHLDNFINSVYLNIRKKPRDSYYFNMIETEWISNQELLVFTSILYYFVEQKINFSVDLYEKGRSFIGDEHKRKVYFLVNLWDNWRIYKIIPDEKIEKCLGLSDRFIESLKEQHNINLLRNEIYNANHINTPFQTLKYLKDYKDSEIDAYVNKFLNLESATIKIINTENLYHPFLDESLGSILMKELYENFLDHFKKSFIGKNHHYCFFSLSVHGKINEENNPKDKIQYILEKNFKEESIPELKSFFYDNKSNLFKNQAYLEFTFLDYGDGICQTLKNEYEKVNRSPEKKDESENIDDSEVLSFAFEPTSSKDPIYSRYNESNIPRGLFDVISIVRRYRGLLVARSNYGKIIYNFSETTGFKDSLEKFNDDNGRTYFPGTIISLYLPALNVGEKLDYSSIKPEIAENITDAKNERIVNLYPILDSISHLSGNKKELYSSLISKLDNILITETPTITFINVKGCEQLDLRLLKKSMFYFLTDYIINLYNNIIILNSPSENLIQNLKLEILSLNNAIKKFVVHPLPIVYRNETESKELILEWLGVFDERDKKNLNKLLFGRFKYNLAESDFENPDEVVGQINYYNDNGNLDSFLPSKQALINKLNNVLIHEYFNLSDEELFHEIIKKKKCLKSEGLYLCNGNYYQEEYLQLSNILEDKEDCSLICGLLRDKINEKCNRHGIKITESVFIGVTSSSHRILDELKPSYRENDFIYFDNYLWFENEAEKIISPNKNYILICDAISTGHLVKRIDNYLNSKSSKLSIIGVLANALDDEFENTKEFIRKYEQKLCYLGNYHTKKYRRDYLPDSLKSKLKSVIRINPYTNTPITFQIKDTFYDRIIIKNEKFIEHIDDNDISIGFRNYNNLIHPYFFKLNQIIEKENIKLRSLSRQDNSILIKSFEEINKQLTNSKNIKIFYPKKSDINFLDFNLFKTNVLGNNKIEDYKLERFKTEDGWKFPHLSDYYNSIITNNDIIIIDDGSCTGDSLTQMINEVSYFFPSQIYLICIVGRINDHKREFFSKLSQLCNDINLKVFFTSYWHIPTFHLNRNPYSKEINELKDLTKIRNTPGYIIEIAKNILSQVSPQKDNFKEYKYLIPKKQYKGKNDKYPKRDILLVRDKIGQVIGHRYYKESFNWFNNLVAKLENPNYKKVDRLKEIELLSMCILYEPYLFEELSKVMPDVRDKMEEFVESLIFGNSKKGGLKIDLNKHLFYDWTESTKNIIHLFFIVYKNEKLSSFLEISKLNMLLEFSKNQGDIKYILYKLLLFYPINNNKKEELKFIRKKINKFLIHLDGQLSTKYSSIKIFKHYIATLPSDENVNDRIVSIQSGIERISDEKYHKSNLFNTKQEIDGLATDIERKLIYSENYDFELEEIKKKIEPIFEFLEKILSFSSQHPDFFISEEIYFKIESANNSLRSLYLMLFIALYEDLDIEFFRETLTKIFNDFILSNSELNKIFSDFSTKNIDEILESYKRTNENSKDKNIKIENLEDQSINLVFNKYFFELICHEIFNNLRYAEKNSVVFSIKKHNKSNIKIRIHNRIDFSVDEKGSNIGTRLLNNINNNYFGSSYTSGRKGSKYYQFLKFKI